jgi:hypothetical protein
MMVLSRVVSIDPLEVAETFEDAFGAVGQVNRGMEQQAVLGL